MSAAASSSTDPLQDGAGNCQGPSLLAQYLGTLGPTSFTGLKEDCIRWQVFA